jgi:hypothetical protein
MRSDFTISARPEKPRPVPCVPVEIAPAIVCASMSPWFARARLYGPSSFGSSCSFVPARKVATFVSGFTDTSPR